MCEAVTLITQLAGLIAGAVVQNLYRALHLRFLSEVLFLPYFELAVFFKKHQCPSLLSLGGRRE